MRRPIHISHSHNGPKQYNKNEVCPFIGYTVHSLYLVLEFKTGIPYTLSVVCMGMIAECINTFDL